MASTAKQIIKAAYQMIGYLGASEEMTSADSHLGLDQLNKMLDSWSNEPQACFAILEQSVALVPGKSAYTIGTTGGADISATRPIRIIEGPGAAYLQDGNANNYRVDVVTRQQWNQIANRGENTTSNIPDTLFYDPQFPLGTINLWPTPNEGGMTLFFDSYQQLVDMMTLVQVFSLPPGYEIAIQSNLACLLFPFCFKGDPPNTVTRIAARTLNTIKRANKRNNVAQFDSEIVSRSQPSWNIYSGRYQ